MAVRANVLGEGRQVRLRLGLWGYATGGAVCHIGVHVKGDRRRLVIV